MRKNSGFGVVGIVLIVAAVALVGLIGWRIYDANKSKQGNSTNANNQNQQSSNASQNNQSDQTQQSDPNEGYVVIKEWDVRFKLVDGLVGVEYFKPGNVADNQLTFTTSAMASAAAACSSASGNIVIGLVTRNREEVPVNGGVLAKIGDYYYQYRGPESTCGAGNDIELKASTGLAQSLKSIETSE